MNSPARSQSDVDLCLSLLLNTKYIFDEHLGKGASGCVVRGHTRTSARDCAPQFEYSAIKIFPRKKHAHYERERDTLERLRGCDNIVQMISAVSTKEDSYIIMEECEADLDQILADDVEFDEDSVKSIFKQMVVGIIAVHANGFCHHDIKLNNFLVGKDGNIRLADFGYALRLDDEDYTVEHDGFAYIRGEYAASSPAYSSHQVLNKLPHLPHLTDIYGLGICLYRILCGRFPFCHPKKDSLETLMNNVEMSDDLTTIYFPERVSLEARDLICGMIARDEEDRYGWEGIISHPWCFYDTEPETL